MRPRPAGVSALPASLSPEPIGWGSRGRCYISSAFDGDALCDSNPEASGKSVAVSENKRFEMRWLPLCWNLRTVERMLDSAPPQKNILHDLLMRGYENAAQPSLYHSFRERQLSAPVPFCPFTHDSNAVSLPAAPTK